MGRETKPAVNALKLQMMLKHLSPPEEARRIEDVSSAKFPTIVWGAQINNGEIEWDIRGFAEARKEPE